MPERRNGWQEDRRSQDPAISGHPLTSPAVITQRQTISLGLLAPTISPQTLTSSPCSPVTPLCCWLFMKESNIGAPNFLRAVSTHGNLTMQSYTTGSRRMLRTSRGRVQSEGRAAVRWGNNVRDRYQQQRSCGLSLCSRQSKLTSFGPLPKASAETAGDNSASTCMAAKTMAKICSTTNTIWVC